MNKKKLASLKKQDLDLEPGFNVTAEYRLGQIRGWNDAIDHILSLEDECEHTEECWCECGDHFDESWYCLGCDKAKPPKDQENRKDFNEWLSTHPCNQEELWKIQNMLGDLYADENHTQAVQAWHKSGKQGITVEKVNPLIAKLQDPEVIEKAVRAGIKEQNEKYDWSTHVEKAEKMAAAQKAQDEALNQENITYLLDKVDNLKAENKVMRDALKKIANNILLGDSSSEYDQIIKLARKALSSLNEDV